MARSEQSRPNATTTIATLIEARIRVYARCPTCDTRRDVDLRRIAKAKGEDYRLWNRKTACTLTPGCKGRVFFKYHWNMWDHRMAD